MLGLFEGQARFFGAHSARLKLLGGSVRGVLRFILTLTVAIAPLVQAETAATTTNVLIDNSYIVTFRPSRPRQASVITPPATNALGKVTAPTPFGEHSTGQSRAALANAIGIRGQVVSIFEAINAAHLRIDAAEAEQLRKDPRVLRVEQNMLGTVMQTVQMNPGWALDRLDQNNTALDARYIFNANGLGRTIYVLDTGLDLANQNVAAEFGNRATVFWDINGQGGADCHGHGTQVASAAAGTVRGVAKGATVIAVKITTGCTGNSDTATWAQAFNWLALNAPRGTIANLSSGLSFGFNNCGNTAFVQAVEDAIRAAFNAGIIAVVSAGNDNCNTANFTPTRIPEAFVVGATDVSRFQFGQDARSNFSRFGNNISVFSPGTNVVLLNFNGNPITTSGTSFAAPFMSGMFAVGCQAAGTFCNDMANSGVAYEALRNIGTLGTVVNQDGTALPFGTVSRFISRQPW